MTHSRFAIEPVDARIGDCLCPGTPHPAGDFAYLNPRLSFQGGEVGTAAVVSGIDDPDAAQRALIEVYLRHEVRGWNLTDDAGEPVPYDADLLLSDWEAARAVGEVADSLYSDGLMRPLLAAVSESLRAGPTVTSTSARTRSATKRRKR